MCVNCASDGIGRRDFMKFSAAGSDRARSWRRAACGASGGRRADRALAPDALAALKSGNERYVSQSGALHGRSRGKPDSGRRAGQAPWATIISCADSRVPPELIFGGHGVGELFVSRDAGNLVDTATLGTVEYGAAVLGSPLIVVLAHTACGAVKAACDVVTKNATFPGAIGQMIEPIVPAALAVRNDPGDFTNNAAKESAKRTAGRTDRGEHDRRRSGRHGKGEDRGGDLRPANRRRHLSRLAARLVAGRARAGSDRACVATSE